MKHIRNLLMVGALALTVLGVTALVSAQEDATATPETTPEAATAPGFLGIAFEAADGGVRVADIVLDGPADDAGIQVDDVITAIGDTAVTGDNIRATVRALTAGETVTVILTRGDETLTIDVTLGEVPEEEIRLRPVVPERGVIPEFRNRPNIERMFNRPLLGVQIENTDDGVVVTEVVEGSAAEDAGLLADDVITAINGETVESAGDAVRLIAEAAADVEPGEFTVTVTVLRDGETVELTATLTKPEVPDIQVMPGLGRGGMRGFGMGGIQIVPREGEDGAFDVVVPFRPADASAVTDDVTAALESLGIRIVPREDDDGVFDLYVPLESLGDGSFEFPDLEGLLPEGFDLSLIPGDLDFNFVVPGGRGFRFQMPEMPVVPTTPSTPGSEL